MPVSSVEQMRGSATDLKRALSKVARFQNSLRINHADNHVDGVFFEPLEFSKLRDRHERAIDIKRVESLPLGPARHIGVKTLAGFDQRRQHFHRAVFRRGFDLFHDRGDTLFFHRQIAVWTKLRSGLGKEEPKKMINFRYCRDGGFAAAACDPLLDRDAGR